MELTLFFAFSAGSVAAFNPCGIAMFPAYIGFQLDQKKSQESFVSLIFRGSILGLFMTMGFLLVFALVSFVLILGGTFVASFLPIISVLIGVLIISLGVYLLLSNTKFSSGLFSSLQFGNVSSNFQTFLFGIAYALISISCALPVFLAALGIIIGVCISSDNLIDVFLGMIFYSLGMGTIITGVTLGVLFFDDAVQKIVIGLTPIISSIGKFAMIISGIYIIYYWVLGTGSDLFFMRLENFGF